MRTAGEPACSKFRRRRSRWAARPPRIDGAAEKAAVLRQALPNNAAITCRQAEGESGGHRRYRSETLGWRRRTQGRPDNSAFDQAGPPGVSERMVDRASPAVGCRCRSRGNENAGLDRTNRQRNCRCLGTPPPEIEDIQRDWGGQDASPTPKGPASRPISSPVASSATPAPGGRAKSSDSTGRGPRWSILHAHHRTSKLPADVNGRSGGVRGVTAG